MADLSVKDRKIALLMDCDNISFRLIEKVLQDLEEYGDVIIKKAYGNWRNEGLKNWVTKLTELSIKPIHQIDYTKGKNATDMAIVIDAMDLMHLKKADAFALVSSDSDFTPLVMKLQEEGFKVYGFGNEKAPPSLKNACSIYTDISVANLPEEKGGVPKDKKKISSKSSNKEISQKVIDVFLKISPENKRVPLEKINEELKSVGIEYKALGFSQLKLFLDSLNIFNLIINVEASPP